MGDWKRGLLGERKGRASKVAEKLLMEWRKGVKGAEARELEKERLGGGNETWQQKI